MGLAHVFPVFSSMASIAIARLDRIGQRFSPMPVHNGNIFRSFLNRKPQRHFDNLSGDEIKETLEQLICHLPQDAQLFVWFSGKSGGMLQESFQETLLVPESQIDWKNNTAIETIRGLWLEDTLFGMIARKEGLKLW